MPAAIAPSTRSRWAALEPMNPHSPYLPFMPQVRSPRRRLPTGTCDCHFHVFEDPLRYPMAAPRSYTPTPAPLEAYRRMAQAVGIDRAVLVHPSVYGRDHRSFEDTLSACGGWMRGVAVVYPDTTDAQIEHWHALGARGTRCNALFAGGTELEALPGIAARVAPLRWHLQLLVDVAADPDAVARAADTGLPVVVDHFGHTSAGGALATAGFRNLLALVRERRAWVKISGAYRVSPQRAVFNDVAALVEALCKADAGQLVWGSDWPHPAIAPPMPDDGDLADALFGWLGETERQRILVDNPSRLYWAN